MAKEKAAMPVKGTRVKVLVGEWGEGNLGEVVGPKGDMLLVRMKGPQKVLKFWPKDCEPVSE